MAHGYSMSDLAQEKSTRRKTAALETADFRTRGQSETQQVWEATWDECTENGFIQKRRLRSSLLFGGENFFNSLPL